MDYLATGVLKGPHGILGFMKLHTYSQEYRHLTKIESVLLRKKDISCELSIESIEPKGKEILIKFKGIDTPELARRYNGYELWIPREMAVELEAGEYYVADLAQCSLLVAGSIVGKVVAVIDGPQALLLEVEAEKDNKRYLVPFMEQFIGDVNIESKELELLVPELLT